MVKLPLPFYILQNKNVKDSYSQLKNSVNEKNLKKTVSSTAELVKNIFKAINDELSSVH